MNFADLFAKLCKMFSSDSSFLSGIIGALVGSIAGGLIAYFIQKMALNEARQIRANELKITQQALAQSLLFKVMRIHGNCSAISNHMKICWSRISDEKSEPWQAFTPFANLPAEVVFTTDEQTMLFGLKDNKVFEATFDLDVAHNSLLEAIKVLSEERRLLSGNLENETFEGEVGSSTLDKKTYLRLKPKMIEVNQLAQYGLNESERTENEAIQAMDLLTALFKARLGLMVKTEIKLNTIEASNS